MDEDEKKEKKKAMSRADGKHDKGESSKAKKVRKEKKGKPASRKKDGDVEIVEAGEMVPRIKPKLDEESRNLLVLRKERKSDKPEFLRQEWYRYGRVGRKWRKPRGLHSKMRRHMKRRINVVSIGYGSPAKVRSLHSSGFRERLVHNVGDLEALDPGVHAARIAHSVGTRKRLEIIGRADDLGIRVLNRGVKREAKPGKEKKAKKDEKAEDIEIEDTDAGEEMEIEDETEEPAIEDHEDDGTPEKEDLGGEQEGDEASDTERNKGGGAQGGEKQEPDEKGGGEL